MSGRAEKSWLSPFLAVAYLAVAGTGLILLVHIKFPGLYSVHKWGGFLFIIAGTAHLITNWRIFTSYFSKSRAVWAAGIGLLSIVVIGLAAPADDDHSRGWQNGGKNLYRSGNGNHRW